MDFITGLPDINGFTALLVCVNKFGKLCQFIPCRAGENELSAPAVAKLFFKYVVHLYGVPHVVLHDWDPRFTAAFWKELWKTLGCKTEFLSAFHLQTDDQMEQYNQTIQPVVQALGHEHGLNWLEAIPLVEMTLNNAVNDSMRMSPAFILYG